MSETVVVDFADRDIGSKRRGQLEKVDNMPRELRECVHEFGLPIVSMCMMAGVTKPNVIRQLVKEIQEGSRDISQYRTPWGPLRSLDKLLLEAGADISAEKLVKFLISRSWIVVPMEPMPCMIDASLEAVSGHNVLCTKREKHTRRIRAAMAAALRFFQ